MSKVLDALANFNSRSREGSDLLRGANIAGLRYFNSRSREGSDQNEFRKGSITHHFNSRSREGSDKTTKSKKSTKKISIHAPVKGATTFLSKR